MIGFLGAAYVWVKAAHIIFVIFWMASLFMLPRYFIYHQECAVGSDEDQRWVERERLLIRIILNPAMTIAWLFGLALAANAGAWTEGWFLAKIAFVAGLSGYGGWMSSYAERLSKGVRALSDRQLRMINEIPGIAIAMIVILVVVRPF